MKPLIVTPKMKENWKRFNKKRKAEDKPALNFPLWVKTRNRIAAIPESYCQSTFGREDDRSPCGAVACLVGEGIIASAPSVKVGIRKLFDLIKNKKTGMFTVGTELFGLDEHEEGIFEGDASGWPLPYLESYNNAGTHSGQAKAAVAYLTHVIRTGKVLE